MGALVFTSLPVKVKPEALMKHGGHLAATYNLSLTISPSPLPRLFLPLVLTLWPPYSSLEPFTCLNKTVHYLKEFSGVGDWFASGSFGDLRLQVSIIELIQYCTELLRDFGTFWYCHPLLVNSVWDVFLIDDICTSQDGKCKHWNDLCCWCC